MPTEDSPTRTEDELLKENTELNNMLGHVTEKNRLNEIQMKKLERELEIFKQKEADAGGPPHKKEHDEGSRNIKLPAFLPEKPDLWFSQIEALFDVNNITSEIAKYGHVVGKIEGRWANEIEDLIRKRPATKPYTTIKEELIDRISQSETTRIRKLLAEADLGDSTPSQFLRRLKYLAGPSSTQESMMKTLWLQPLPSQVQAILQAQPSSTSLDDLAKIADRIVETIPVTPRPSVYATSIPAEATLPQALVHATSLPSNNQPPNVCSVGPSVSGNTDTTAAFTQVIQMLTDRLDKIEAKLYNSPKSNYRGRSPGYRPRSRSRSKTPSQNGLCWYHNTFGAEAEKCTKPCQFPTNTKGSQ